jgi:hypothetical protein
VTKSRNLHRPRLQWQPHQVEYVREHYANSRTDDIATALGVRPDQVFRMAYRLGLKKSEAYLNSPAACRLDGIKGSSSRFKPGHTTWNKGKKGLQLSPHTQFKPGRPAHEASNYVPIGTLRVSKDGYLERKVSDDPTVAPVRRWRGVHRLIWEAAHGPIPSGHVVAFKGRKPITELALITLDQLELITKAQVMRENTRHNYGPEINELIYLRSSITRAVNTRAKQEGSTP